MILYNVTVNIDYDVHDEWLRWMKEVHIPDVMASGLFLENKIARILAEEEGGKSYSIQYICKDMAAYNKYQSEYAPRLQQDHESKFRGKFVAFRTILNIIHQTDSDGKA